MCSRCARCADAVCNGCVPVFHPEGGLRLVWNVSMLLLVVYICVFVPLQVSANLAQFCAISAQLF